MIGRPMRAAALLALLLAPLAATAQTVPPSLPVPAEFATALPLRTGDVPNGNGPE